MDIGAGRDKNNQNVASDLGLHCLPLIQQFLDTLTGGKKIISSFKK